MNISEVYQWDRAEFLQVGFGALVPRLAEAHHVIGRNTSELLNFAMSIDDSPFGIMGEFPPFDAQGETYMSFELSACEDFVLWGQPQNQRRLEDFPGRGLRNTFTFLAPISRQEAACNTFKRLSEFWEDYYYCVDRIADSLDDLGVLYLPLEPDGQIALVACSRKHPNADRISNLLETTRLPLLRLIGSGSSLQWEKVGDWSPAGPQEAAGQRWKA